MLGPRKTTQPWTVVASDIMGPLPRSKRGNKYIIVFQDLFTKWVEAKPVKRADATAVADALREKVITKFGSPRFLLNDNGSQYSSKIMKKLCDDLHIIQVFTPPSPLSVILLRGLIGLLKQ